MKPPQLHSSWQEILEEEWNKPYIKSLAEFLAKERASNIPVYPPKVEVFSAFNETPFDKVNVVIVGQDPYHGAGQAHGLSFSVKPGIAFPPSLKNIFKELKEDLGVDMPKEGCLSKWARQGVLMLNAILTVRENEPASHVNQGWEIFTDQVIQRLAMRQDPIIFVLWGKKAEEKCRSVKSHHYILRAAHPSPFSANNGFFGCRHFSKINDILNKQGKEAIQWGL